MKRLRPDSPAFRLQRKEAHREKRIFDIRLGTSTDGRRRPARWISLFAGRIFARFRNATAACSHCPGQRTRAAARRHATRATCDSPNRAHRYAATRSCRQTKAKITKTQSRRLAVRAACQRFCICRCRSCFRSNQRRSPDENRRTSGRRSCRARSCKPCTATGQKVRHARLRNGNFLRRKS